jgi:hypothetical protein
MNDTAAQLRFLLVAFVMFIVSGCGKDPIIEGLRQFLQGTVMSQATGSALQGVTITVDGDSLGTTDVAGSYVIVVGRIPVTAEVCFERVEHETRCYDFPSDATPLNAGGGASAYQLIVQLTESTGK